MWKPGAALLLCGTSAVALAADSPLVGKWEAMVRTSSELGKTLELHADGTLTGSLGSMVDATYRVEDGTLITTHKDERTGQFQEAKMKIRFEGDTLVEKSPAAGAEEIRMKRETPKKAGAAPIVGTWSYPKPPRGTAYLTFTPGGNELFRYPLRTFSGKWSVIGTLLNLAYEGTPSQVSNYTIENGILTIDPGNGPPTKYRRAPTE
ncbi:MAG: hypothetical protein ACRD16_11545 [Thermoanaerobaculia bacterium]